MQNNTKSNHKSSKNERKISLLTSTLRYFIGSINDIASKTSAVKDAENLGKKKSKQKLQDVCKCQITNITQELPAWPP